MPRYEIRTSTTADARELEQLRRAFARTAGQRSPSVDEVDVFEEGGCLVVVMRVLSSDDIARREGERAFALAWYDAFGRRGSVHAWRLSDVPSPAHSL